VRIPEFSADQIRLLETIYAGFVEAGTKHDGGS
jgi:hypothetical protein